MVEIKVSIKTRNKEIPRFIDKNKINKLLVGVHVIEGITFLPDNILESIADSFISYSSKQLK